MKKPALTGYVFDPVAKTLDFSGTSGFTIQGLQAVIHEATGKTLYAKGRTNSAPKTIAGSVITLSDYVDTTGMNASDALFVQREDGVDVASDAKLATVATGIGAPADAAPASDTASGSVIAKLTRMLATLTTISSYLRGSTSTTDAAGTLTPATNAQALAANTSRQLLIITNTGANPMTVRFGTAATALAGHIIGAGQNLSFDSKVPTGTVNLFSTAGTTYHVTSG